MKKVPLFVLIILVLLLTGCMQYRVKDGLLRDTLFSVEETKGGAYRIFLTHDDVAGYCTYDKALGAEALELLQTHSGEVLLGFRFINETDPEWNFWNGSDCKTTSSGDIYMFLMESIQPVPARSGSN